MTQPWLKAALDYLPLWLEHQMRVSEQPGCAIAVVHRGKLLYEGAFGHANQATGEKLTPRHRFRCASHSKTFTATGIMRLREQGKLRLDDPVGRYVDGLHPQVAEATLAQLMSHGAGLTRDGEDSSQWQQRRPFLNEKELRAALAKPPILPDNSRFKYSNHAYGLLGLVIATVTGRPYRDWIKAEVVDRVGLKETTPDMPAAKGGRLVAGHSSKFPLGERVVVPADDDTHALSAATGFVATAADLARFFNQLDPVATKSVLSAASRREMVRRHRRNEHSSLETHYGLGVAWGRVGDWRWFGHSGGFPSTISRTATVVGQELTISILTNSTVGWANQWSDGAIGIAQAFARHGAPTARTRPWSGRWWSLWGCADLVPVKDKVLVAAPGLLHPFTDAAEIAVTGKDKGVIRQANGYFAPGETAALERDGKGRVRTVRLAGNRLLGERRWAAEMKRRYSG
jgi:CubicO group peptidase (beta-lactamase class C family)